MRGDEKWPLGELISLSVTMAVYMGAWGLIVVRAPLLVITSGEVIHSATNFKYFIVPAL